MMIVKRVLLVVVLLVSGVMTLAQDDPESTTVFLPFIPNIQFAPVYVAIEKGYFAEAGFDVMLEYGGEPDGLERLAVDDLDFAFVGGEQIILARANERPVVFVYEWYQRTPIGLVVPQYGERIDIETPSDMAERKIGVPGRFGATYSGLTSMLDSVALTEQDIQLEEIGFNAPDVICAGGVEAAAIYINNEPLQIRNRALAGDCGDVTNVTVIAAADYADMVSNGLAVSENAIAQQPEQVAAFVTAFERGLVDTLNNPLEAYILSANHIEGLPLDNPDILNDLAEATNIFLADSPEAEAIRDRRDFLYAQARTVLSDDELLQLEVLLETAKLWDADTLGLSALDSWELTQDTLVSMGFVDSPIDLTAAYSNAFLP